MSTPAERLAAKAKKGGARTAGIPGHLQRIASAGGVSRRKQQPARPGADRKRVLEGLDLLAAEVLPDGE